MACGGHPVLLPAPHGGAHAVAAQVRRGSGGGWQVELRPGLAVVNHLSLPLHLCLSCDGAHAEGGGSRGSAAASPTQPLSPGRRQRGQHLAVQVGSGGRRDLRLPDSSMQLRLWLGGNLAGGPGSGWSQAVAVQHYQQRRELALMVLHSSPAAAATATAAGLDAPAAAAHQTPLGSVLAQLAPPDGASGQATLHLWPPLLLHNSMPCALRLLLPAANPQQPFAPQQEQPVEEVVVPPGGSRQLAVPLQGGAVGSLLALEAAGADGGGESLASRSGSRGMAIVVPPLIAESADERWFGAAAASPRGSKPAGPAVYIAPPGESAALRMPLLAAPGGEPAAAPEGAAQPNGGSQAGAGSAEPTVLAADCVMVTQPHSEALPCMQLALLPALAVHNCLPVPLLFQARLLGPAGLPGMMCSVVPSLLDIAATPCVLYRCLAPRPCKSRRGSRCRWRLAAAAWRRRRLCSCTPGRAAASRRSSRRASRRAAWCCSRRPSAWTAAARARAAAPPACSCCCAPRRRPPPAAAAGCGAAVAQLLKPAQVARQLWSAGLRREWTRGACQRQQGQRPHSQ